MSGGRKVLVIAVLALAALMVAPAALAQDPTNDIYGEDAPPLVVSGSGGPSGALGAEGSGNLPFTGAELVLFALVGAALIGTGVLLRRTARDRR